MKLGINTRFRTQSTTGVQRYAAQVLEALGSYTDLTLIELGPDRASPRSRVDELFTLTGRGEQLGCDVVLSMCNWSPIFRTRRSVVVIHDCLDQTLPHLYTRRYRYLRRAYLEAVRRGHTEVVTVSTRSQKALMELLERDIKIAPAGVAVPEDNEWKRLVSAGREQRTDQRPYLLFVGAHDQRKNVDFCAGLMPWLERNDYQLFITMRSGSRALTSSLSPWINQNSARIRLLIDPDDTTLSELYAGADALVHPSIAEGFGLPLLEAAAHGTPFISGPVGIAEDAASYSWQVQPLEVELWTEGLDEILRTNADHLARECRDTASRFTWDSSTAAIANICRARSELNTPL